jgi:hypothetical protein
MRMRFATTHSQDQEDTRKVKTQTTAQTVEVRADGEGLVSHAGAYLLVELADRLGLTAALSEGMAPTREAALGGAALPGGRAFSGRAQAGAPASAARRRGPGAIGPANGAAAAAQLAVGRGAGGSLRAIAGAGARVESVVTGSLHSHNPPHRTCRSRPAREWAPALRFAEDQPRRNATAALRSRRGVVTYLKSPGLTLLGENGGSRLSWADPLKSVRPV